MADTGKSLVTGATGNTGSILVPSLREAGVDVRALVRDEARAQALKELAAETAVGDLEQPETITPALEGVDKDYLLTWNGPPQAEHAANVIEAAEETGELHIVRHSMWDPENSRIVQQGELVEEQLKSSNLSWTILRPTFFMQNLRMSAQTIASEAEMYWPLEDTEIAMIDIRDVVDCAVTVLTEEGHEGKTYTLTGPEANTFDEGAEAMTEALERDVEYVSVPDEAAEHAMVDMGMHEGGAEGYVELFEGFRAGYADHATDDVATLQGEPARSIEQFADDFAGMFQAEGA